MYTTIASLPRQTASNCNAGSHGSYMGASVFNRSGLREIDRLLCKNDSHCPSDGKQTSVDDVVCTKYIFRFKTWKLISMAFNQLARAVWVVHGRRRIGPHPFIKIASWQFEAFWSTLQEFRTQDSGCVARFSQKERPLHFQFFPLLSYSTVLQTCCTAACWMHTTSETLLICITSYSIASLSICSITGGICGCNACQILIDHSRAPAVLVLVAQCYKVMAHPKANIISLSEVDEHLGCLFQCKFPLNKFLICVDPYRFTIYPAWQSICDYINFSYEDYQGYFALWQLSCHHIHIVMQLKMYQFWKFNHLY